VPELLGLGSPRRFFFGSIPYLILYEERRKWHVRGKEMGEGRLCGRKEEGRLFRRKLRGGGIRKVMYTQYKTLRRHLVPLLHPSPFWHEIILDSESDLEIISSIVSC